MNSFARNRFESGSMLNSNGDPLIEDLSGWVITAPVKIDKSRASVTADMNAAAKDKVKRENDWIERFDVAGDYSAERLYAKLSSMYLMAVHSNLPGVDYAFQRHQMAQFRYRIHDLWKGQGWQRYIVS